MAFKKNGVHLCPPGDVPSHPKILGPDSTKLVTTHVQYSTRQHPACISLQWHPLKIPSIDKSGHMWRRRSDGLALTGYCFTSRLLDTNQYYYFQTAPLFGHPSPRLASPTLVHTILDFSDPPLLQYKPYHIGNGNIVQRPSYGALLCFRRMSRP